MVRCVVQANILEVVVVCFAAIFKHGRLEYRHANRTHNAWFRFTSVDEFGIDVFEVLGQ